jgi:hypothetical protein
MALNEWASIMAWRSEGLSLVSAFVRSPSPSLKLPRWPPLPLPSFGARLVVSSVSPGGVDLSRAMHYMTTRCMGCLSRALAAAGGGTPTAPL